MDASEKVFLQPGDMVTLKQDLPNKPVMLFCGKVMEWFKPNGEFQPPRMRGVRCIWFTKDGFIQEMVTSTKDLVLVKRANEK